MIWPFWADAKDKEALKGYEVVHFQPFDPVHKRTEAAVKGKDGKTFKVSKGAPQVILALSANAGQLKAGVEKAVNEFAAHGFRSLGVARAEGDGPWQFLGVLPLFAMMPPAKASKLTPIPANTRLPVGRPDSSGCFSRQRRMTLSSPGGRWALLGTKSGGSSAKTAFMVSTGVLRRKARVPLSIS